MTTENPKEELWIPKVILEKLKKKGTRVRIVVTEECQVVWPGSERTGKYGHEDAEKENGREGVISGYQEQSYEHGEWPNGHYFVVMFDRPYYCLQGMVEGALYSASELSIIEDEFQP